MTEQTKIILSWRDNNSFCNLNFNLNLESVFNPTFKILTNLQKMQTGLINQK